MKVVCFLRMWLWLRLLSDNFYLNRQHDNWTSVIPLQEIVCQYFTLHFIRMWEHTSNPTHRSTLTTHKTFPSTIPKKMHTDKQYLVSKPTYFTQGKESDIRWFISYLTCILPEWIPKLKCVVCEKHEYYLNTRRWNYKIKPFCRK